MKCLKRFYPIGMRIRIEKDIDFGIDKKSGWSVAIDGSYLVQFDKWIIIALVKALWAYQWWGKDD